MAQKDKVKELVGRGLDSYHTKSLQQIDKIEKKNKQQNHKISMLTNELDNDYITKTEEGSVISLEHSKEGMVYIDSLEGNTMVNYCTDGSKEMTLNGDIDVEGTFVTTTEGVDNGKVDVMCEGNTLVNLISTRTPSYAPNNFEIVERSSKKIHLKCITEYVDSNTYQMFYTERGLIKPNTTYTLGFYKYDNIPINFIALKYNQVNWIASTKKIEEGNYLKYVITTNDNVTDSSASLVLERGRQSLNINDIVHVDHMVLLEGDYTNESMRNYFEGMKSVGQDDANGHKIEILSSNGKPNLFRNSGFLNGLSGFAFHNQSKGTIIEDATSGSGKILKVVAGENLNSGFYQANLVPHIENTKYTLSCYCKGDINSILDLHIERHKHTRVQFTNNDWVRVELTSELNPTNWNRTITFYSQTPNATFYVKDIKIEVSDYATPYIPHTTETNYNTFKRLNKKEILLNEPLRGLPNGVKDRFVKLGGKWYIERNCVGYTPDTSTATFRKNYDVTSIIDFKIDNIKNSNQSAQSFHIECLSTIPYGDPSGTKWQNETHWLKYYPMTKNTISTEGQRDKGSVSIFYNKEWTDQQIIDWCNNNNLKFILPCETPTYEEITDVELMTYLDTTHISNNSIIPCNMKIKNSGYNAIIKPSTLYTVALDTNKSGTIGMNLGGVKGTTTNNVLTLTTPATLTDDSLRLYGKGIKGSKVRILEGDKTNWIPSHFEGMKSSFEDKFDVTDNTYKMEILSNNINLVDYENIGHKGIPTNEFTIKGDKITLNSSKTYQALYYHIPVKRGEDYIVSCKNITNGNVLIYDTKVQGHHADKYKLSIGKNTVKARITPKSDYITLRVSVETMVNTDCTFEQLMIHRANVSSEFKFNKFNKIQFSSIEPLRGVDDVKDKFVFKDDKLMIERNCGKGVLGGEISNYHCWNNNPTDIVNGYIYYNEHIPPLNNVKTFGNVKNNLLPSNQGGHISKVEGFRNTAYFGFSIHKSKLGISDVNAGLPNQPIVRQYFNDNPLEFIYQLAEPTYEEIPYELQKIILEGYENGTLFFDTNIPPTSTVTYAGETPIVKSVKLNKTEVLNNTTDINDNIIPYLMDMDYRVVCLELAAETQGISMARLFGGVYEMLKRDILSSRYSIDEYKHRLDAYLSANKITHEEYNKLGDMLNE